MNKVIILSGGLDSTILAYKLANEFDPSTIYALTFHYGQRHSIETTKAKITCSKLGINHKILDISFLGELVKGVSSLIKDSEIEVPHIKDVLGDPQPSSYVCNRNMIFISLAISYAEAIESNSVYLGLQKQDIYSYFDSTAEFIERINYVNQLNRLHNIEIITPFIDLSKRDEIKIGIDLNVPFEDSWTCYSGREKACGKCPSCSERIGGFAFNKIKDPVPYEIDVPWKNLFEQF